MRTALLAVALLAGCSTPLKQLKLELGKRASTELNCPEQELRYKELAYLISTTAVEVSGCGRVTTWKVIESRWKRVSSDEPVR